MEDVIDVVTTATLRPALLDITYRSFTNRLLNQFTRRRLIINVDPIGDAGASLAEVLQVCHAHFDEVVYRSPETPSFPAAVHWAWSAVRSDYFLHLEDDWLLKKSVSADRVQAYFQQDTALAEVTLNLSINAKAPPGLSLRPSFFRKAFIDEALPYFDLEQDPEKQWRERTGGDNSLAGWRFWSYGESGEGRFVADIGKRWRKASGFRKWDHGQLTWSSAPSPAYLVKTYYRLKANFYLNYWRLMSG